MCVFTTKKYARSYVLDLKSAEVLQYKTLNIIIEKRFFIFIDRLISRNDFRVDPKKYVAVAKYFRRRQRSY